MAFVRLFLPETSPLLNRVGRKSKKARISRRQLRKADKALHISAAPSRLTLAIQASNPLAAVAAEEFAYLERKSSLSWQAPAIYGMSRDNLARFCSSSVSRSTCYRL